MTPSTPFKTTKEAANMLASEGKRSGHSKLVRLPFNRFDKLDETTWWLSPPPEIPAYKYGKIVCTTASFEPELFIGLYVEKGLGGQPARSGWATSPKERRYLMDATWLWHDFVEGLKSGEIGRLTNIVEELCNRPVIVAVDGGTVTGDDWDFVSFIHTNGSLQVNPGSTGQKKLSPLSAADSLPDLASLIETTLSGLDWVWIDFHIGLLFSTDTGDDTKSWDAGTIWTKVCAPWASWLR